MMRRLRTTVLVAVLAVGCRNSRTPAVLPPQKEARTAPHPGPIGAPVVPKVEQRHLSEDQILSVLIDSKLPSATSSAAKERLASVGSVRESRPVDSVVQLETDGADAHFLVTYGKDGQGGWKFNYATVTRKSRDRAAATESYKRLDAQLRKRFGVPAWVDADGEAPPTQGWNAGTGAMELRLVQRNDEQGLFVLELTLAEPQGEAE
jgi:hypothetical protein